MARIVPGDDRPVVDYMARDYQSLLASMRTLIPSRLPEWTDFTNEADFGNVLLELFAHVGDILSYYSDRVANESFLSTARSRRSVIDHLRLIGYQLGTAAPAAALLAVSVPADVSDTVLVSRGDAFATRSQKASPSVRFEYTGAEPLVIDFAAIQPDPVTNRKVFGDLTLGSGIPVEEGRMFVAETLGVSDGGPGQRYPIAHAAVIVRPPGPAQQASRDVTVVTRAGSEVVAWTLRETLAFSGASDFDFALEIDAEDRSTVVFGDGANGARPAAGAVVSATYRTGGGQLGNVPAGAIQTIVSASPLALLGATVTNHGPATGGADRESIDHAVAHAPAVFRSLHRAVTAADYEALALSFKGVGKVRAVQGGWNRVNLLVAPAGGRGKVSDVLEAGLKGYLEDKRMLTQVIEIEDVDYIPIFVTAELGIESYYVRSEVLGAVQQAAAALLAFETVDFGQPVFLSSFYEAVASVPGVSFVNITEFRRADSAGPALESTGRIQLSRNELPEVPDAVAHPDYAAGLKVLILPGGGG
jgi:Baseplate J-like protein